VDDGSAALAWLDASEQAALVRAGEVSPAELVDAALARIERLNPRLNAVIYERAERAHAEAIRHRGVGPFGGVPLLLKDAVAHSAGDPYHFGMRALRDVAWVEPRDTWLVQRFRRAGFVIVGKTNTPELAGSVTTEPLAYGPTSNPFEPTRSPGGSSGGSAAAVASGMVPVAHGNDMGGSIRIPAAMCGLVGLKPTRARVSLGPELGEHWAMLTHEHVVTRSVRDTASVLDAVSGAGVGDPYGAPAATRPFRCEVGADPGRLRIGFRTAQPGTCSEASPDGIAAVHETMRLLESLGHVVEPAVVPGLDDPGFGDAIPVLLATAVARELDRLNARLGRPIDTASLEPLTATRAERGRATAAVDYLRALDTAQRWARGVAAWWADGHDVLVTPTVAASTPALGFIGPLEPEAHARMRPYTAFTAAFNVTGQPAVSLPLHVDEAGLPVGVQLVGGFGREDQLLRLSAQLEAARPWRDRRPAVGAC
jgi:amidase